jgi:hypothetical protein
MRNKKSEIPEIPVTDEDYWQIQGAALAITALEKYLQGLSLNKVTAYMRQDRKVKTTSELEAIDCIVGQVFFFCEIYEDDGLLPKH